jgi:hypothetical protein
MAPRKKSTAHRLLPRDIELIAKLVREMPINLRPSWPAIIILAQAATGKAFSRQSLSSHEPIEQSYQARIDDYRRRRSTGLEPREPIVDDDPEQRRVRNIELENASIRGKIEAYEDLLIRIIQNAMSFGITQEQLEAPLVPREQGRSDLDAMAERTREARRSSRKSRT